MKKNIIIVILLIIIIIGVIYIILTGINNKGNGVADREKVSKYSSAEVINYLKEQGYEFENTEFVRIYTTKYVYVSNEENEIGLQKISNPLIGIEYLWSNRDINDSWADIKSIYQNNSEEEKKQYKEYEKWLEYEGLTTKQLTDALDYYQNYGEEFKKVMQ